MLFACSPFAHQRANLCDWLECTYFVVSQHHADEHCVRSNGCSHIFQMNYAVVINREPRNFPPFFLQRFSATAHGWMFDCGGDDVTPLRTRRCANSGDRQIICFGSARSENDLINARANKPGYLTPGPINCRARLLTKCVDTRSVA